MHIRTSGRVNVVGELCHSTAAVGIRNGRASQVEMAVTRRLEFWRVATRLHTEYNPHRKMIPSMMASPRFKPLLDQPAQRAIADDQAHARQRDQSPHLTSRLVMRSFSSRAASSIVTSGPVALISAACVAVVYFNAWYISTG